ncbi:MAG: GH127 / GH146 [uncultured Thermomicrobiales bacterium]|uniref:GH127 / GH146 n=1 Tax=uncultured Thermomicrobiales bacterium TaxID=1645740 RepID=A0A6J4V8H2_9BACT|nr:MAG: GH127 / GH146 [uncultured Thermomicrobiales bacterium]
MAVASGTVPVVVDTARSEHARLRPVAVDAVRLDDAFWAPRLRANREVTLSAQYRLCEETGRIDNFRRLAGTVDAPFQGKYFNDSDVYKWLEAAAWALATEPDAELRKTVDELVETIAAAQRPDGYLNTYFARERAEERWTDLDLHELYCAGHLFQAAVAHHRATGLRRLLDVATRFADHICDTFGPEAAGKRTWSDGHPEVELALVELARATGNRRYLEQAAYFVGVRGHGRLGAPYGRWGSEYHQDDTPFRAAEEVVGHAVRAVYFACGAADLLLETGEPALREASHRLWANATGRKMYAHGGLGARYEGEAFGEDWELPNARAYAETCAAIANAMWNWRLLLAEGEARYADVMELALFNNVLSGLSLDGETYFYQNPLADAGRHRRQPWFGTACCPPNIARMLASLPGYLYGVAEGEVWVHLYAASTATLRLPDGREIGLRQRTRYPWDGEIEIEVEGEGEFALRLRVPGWCGTGATLEVNGRQAETALVPGSYAEVRRTWAAGDAVRLRLPMPVRRLESHPNVAENVGRVAVTRGPLLYCAEAVDNPGVDPRRVRLGDGPVREEFRPDLLGGVVVLAADAIVPPEAGWNGALYRAVSAAADGADGKRVTLTAIPYYAWANREAGPMAVWLQTQV